MTDSEKGKRLLIEEVRTLRTQLAKVEGGQDDREKYGDALHVKIRLNDLLLDSLPHFAILISKDRTVLAANRIR